MMGTVTKYPFIDGVNFQSYFPIDREKNAARYKGIQEQRRLERRVRETRREIDMLTAAGDSDGVAEVKIQLTERNKEYREYCDKHKLKQQYNRTRVVKNSDMGVDFSGESGIIKSGGEDVALEIQRYGRNKSTLVNKTYIESGEYRRKFDSLTDNSEVNKTLYDCAKSALEHRSGTLIEDMYWVDSKSGKIVTKEIDSKEKQAIIYSDKTRKIVKNSTDLISIHTHPGSMPPSIEDFNSCFRNGYIKGVIACHDGKVFVYSSAEMISGQLYEMYIKMGKLDGLSEFDAQVNALKKLMKNYKIDFWEV